MINAQWENNTNKDTNNEEIFSWDIIVEKHDAIQDKLWEINKENIRKYQDKLIFFLMTINKDILSDSNIFEYSNPSLYEEELEPASTKLMELYLKSMPEEDNGLPDLPRDADEWFILFDAFVYPKDMYMNIPCKDYEITENQAYLLAGLLCYSIVNEKTKRNFFKDFQYNYAITNGMLNKIKELDIKTKKRYSNSFYETINYQYSEYDVYEILRQPQIKELFESKLDSLNVQYRKHKVFSNIELMDGKLLDYVTPFCEELYVEEDNYDLIYDIIGYAYRIVEIVKG